MAKLNQKKYRKMLEGASEIQRYLNIFEKGGHQIKFWVRRPQPTFYSDVRASLWHYYIKTEYGNWISIPPQVGKFILKGRKLKGGLANPMARYYGYRAIANMD